MARYRNVDVRVWVDSKYRALGERAKLLWLRLLTGPETTNVPGIVPVGRAALAEAMGWDAEAFLKAFLEISSKGMAKADWDACLVWLPNATKYHCPQSPNVIRSWKTTWDLVPECALKIEAYYALRAFVEGLREPFHKGFTIDLPKGSPIQDQDQDQEQEQEQEGGRPALPTRKNQHPIPLLPPSPTARLRSAPTKLRKTAIAADWQPLPVTVEKLKVELGVNPMPCVQPMVDWAMSKGERRADWEATFRNWVRREAGDGKLEPLPPKQRDLGIDPNDKSPPASEASKQILRDAIAKMTARIDEDNARIAAAMGPAKKY